MMEAELLKALRDAKAPTANDDPGLTVKELASKLYGRDTSQTRNMVTHALQRLKAEGRLIAGRRQIERLSGGMYPHPVYSILPTKKGKR